MPCHSLSIMALATPRQGGELRGESVFVSAPTVGLARDKTCRTSQCGHTSSDASALTDASGRARSPLAIARILFVSARLRPGQTVESRRRTIKVGHLFAEFTVAIRIRLNCLDCFPGG